MVVRRENDSGGWSTLQLTLVLLPLAAVALLVFLALAGSR